MEIVEIKEKIKDFFRHKIVKTVALGLGLLVLAIVVYAFTMNIAYADHDRLKYGGEYNRDNTYYLSRVLSVGESFEPDFAELRKTYDFDRVLPSFSTQDVSGIARADKYGRLHMIGSGRLTGYSLSLIKNDYHVAAIEYGTFYSVDRENAVSISGTWDFEEKIKANPAGTFVLTNDLDFKGKAVAPIPYFSGVLLNPDGKKIMGLNVKSDGKCGLFERVEKAYIDGLLIEQAVITGKPHSYVSGYTDGSVHTGAIAAEVSESYIINSHVTANVSEGAYVGGLFGMAYRSVIEKCSFTGSVSSKAGDYTAGLCGWMSSSGFIDCYAAADVSLETGYGAGGLFGGGYFSDYFTGNYKSIYNIKNCYYYGEVKEGTASDPRYSTTFYAAAVAASVDNGQSGVFDNVYYCADVDAFGKYPDHLSISATYISEADLKSGTGIPGFSSFSFEKGKHPTIKGQPPLAEIVPDEKAG